MKESDMVAMCLSHVGVNVCELGRRLGSQLCYLVVIVPYNSNKVSTELHIS